MGVLRRERLRARGQLTDQHPHMGPDLASPPEAALSKLPSHTHRHTNTPFLVGCMVVRCLAHVGIPRFSGHVGVGQWVHRPCETRGAPPAGSPPAPRALPRPVSERLTKLPPTRQAALPRIRVPSPWAATLASGLDPWATPGRALFACTHCMYIHGHTRATVYPIRRGRGSSSPSLVRDYECPSLLDTYVVVSCRPRTAGQPACLLPHVTCSQQTVLGRLPCPLRVLSIVHSDLDSYDLCSCRQRTRTGGPSPDPMRCACHRCPPPSEATDGRRQAGIGRRGKGRGRKEHVPS